MSGNANAKAVMTLALAMWAAGCWSLDAQDTTITGVLRNAAGEPVSGGLVKVRSENLGLGFLVVSQEQGRYSTPNLLPGKYVIQAFGGNYQSVPGGPADVGKGLQAKVDLVLNVPLQTSPLEKRKTDVDYEKLMPEAEGKHNVVSSCEECHALEWVISARKTREKWRETIDRMFFDMLARSRPLWYNLRDDDRREGLLLNYLTKYFGPDTPPDPRVGGQSSTGPAAPSNPAAKFVAMEFSLPASSTPHDVAVDSGGIVWVSEANGGMLGRFDPNSLTYTRIAPPPGKNSKCELNAVAVDPQGKVWVADDGPNARIIEYDPNSRKFSSYPILDYSWPVPDSGGARIGTLRFLDGNVWGTRLTAQRILKLTPSTGKIVEYPVPRGSAPLGMAVGPDHTIWYTGEVANTIVKLDPGTGSLTAHDAPALRSELKAIAADSAGNLWAAASQTGKLLRLESRTGVITEFAPPTEDSGPYSVDVDTQRNLVWFSEAFTDRIVRFDPANKTFLEFPIPSAGSNVQRIEVDRSYPNRVWWAGARSDTIGYVEVIEGEKR